MSNEAGKPPPIFTPGGIIYADDLNRIVRGSAGDVTGAGGAVVAATGRNIVVRQNVKVHNGHVPWKTILGKTQEAIAQDATGGVKKILYDGEDFTEIGEEFDVVNLGSDLEADTKVLVYRVGNSFFIFGGGGGGGATEWTEVSMDAYTATPASTSRITMSDTSMMQKGMPLKYTLQVDSDTQTVYYGVVDAISANAYIDVMGAPLAHDIAKLEYGFTTKVFQVELFLAGAASFDVTSSTLLATIGRMAFRWHQGPAYMVGFSAKLNVADSTTNPKINIRVGGNALSTNDTNKGIQPSASWVNNPLVAINISNYQLSWLTALEIECSAVAGTKNAEDLSVSCVLVME